MSVSADAITRAVMSALETLAGLLDLVEDLKARGAVTAEDLQRINAKTKSIEERAAKLPQ